MLDLRRIKAEAEAIKLSLEKRGEKAGAADIDAILELDEQRKALLNEVEAMKAQRNEGSKQVGMIKKQGGDATEIMDRVRALGNEIAEKDTEVKAVEEKMNYLLLRIPNIPHPDVPFGDTDEDNIEVRRWGTPRVFDFEQKAHWDIAKDLDIISFERAAKIAGARFALYTGLGARLERAVMNFMLDTHTENGYKEVFPPFIAHERSYLGTGQLPKFAEDMFKLEGTDYYLIPTAEVPVTNIHREEILKGDDLPIKYCAYSACFRSEAGSAGRDTRGLIRQHQFNKVELVKFTKPEESYAEWEKLIADAEGILQKLGLPYRVVNICTGDLGFTAARKYDLEVWLPSYNRYAEISSCSNFEDFQARRADIKFKRDPKSKAEYVHTINGSGLAIGRTVAAILENYQNADGTVTVPEVLVPYMGGKTVIG